jgi:hypothetical protein
LPRFIVETVALSAYNKPTLLISASSLGSSPFVEDNRGGSINIPEQLKQVVIAKRDIPQ